MTLPALALGAADAAPHDERLLTDFGPAARVTWVTVNDGVMGGRSRGGFSLRDGVLRFTGSTDTDGGGFSSVRSRGGTFDLRGYDGIRLRVRADGRRYTFRLGTSTARRGRMRPSYWADFETRKEVGWELLDVPFERFRPQWRGRRLDGPALDLANVDSLGLMIYDKRDGPFTLEADWIRAYRKPVPFRMQDQRGRRRPLVLFAPRADDARLVRQLERIATARAEFEERDMLLVVVLAEGPSRVGARTLDEASARALRSAYDIPAEQFAVRLVGKDGGVKRSARQVVDPAALFAQIDRMPMRQREMRERGGG